MASGMPIADAQAPSSFAGAIGAMVGIPIGYCTNLWRDGFNLENEHGKPTFIKNAELKKRLGVVALSALLSLGITSTEYTLKTYSLRHHTDSIQGIKIRK